MYNPPTFLTVALLADVVGEFEWPAPYVLEDDLPDGIAVVFPRCTLYFSEGFESHMTLKFLSEDTGLDRSVTLTEVLVALRSFEELPDVELIRDPTPHATLDKVRNGIRDLCTLVLTHLRPTLLGDFSWVDIYRRYVAGTQADPSSGLPALP